MLYFCQLEFKKNYSSIFYAIVKNIMKVEECLFEFYLSGVPKSLFILYYHVVELNEWRFGNLLMVKKPPEIFGYLPSDKK